MKTMSLFMLWKNSHLLAILGNRKKIQHGQNLTCCLSLKRQHLNIIMYDKQYCPIFKKQKMLNASERSVFALSGTMRKDDKSYLYTKQARAKMFEKQSIFLYLKHLQSLIKRAGRKVTKICSHYTLNQEKVKKDYVLMNQRSRQ